MAKHRNAKLIIELSAKNMSRGEIARTRHISTHTIKEVLDRASEKGIGWDDVSLLGNDEVAGMLFPEEREAAEAVARPDYGYVHDELRKVGVNLKLLWEEYRDECAEDGKASVSYVTFTRATPTTPSPRTSQTISSTSPDRPWRWIGRGRPCGWSTPSRERSRRCACSSRFSRTRSTHTSRPPWT